MCPRSAAVCLFVVGSLGLATALPLGRGQDVAKTPEAKDEVVQKALVLARLADGEPEFQIWKQKAQLELEVLQAQVEAKKAEILLRTAEYRAKQLAPDLVILTKLEKPVPMEFPNETPLEDVLKYIKEKTQESSNDPGIPIYVDPMGLQKAEKTMTSPVTLNLVRVPLKTTLRLILKQLGLSYTVKHGILTITSESLSESSF